jgi:hypothetical protein
MTEPAAKRELRGLVEAATEAVEVSGRGIERFRGIALYDSVKDETFTSLATFTEAESAVASLSLVQERYGGGAAALVTLQFVYEWLKRLAEPRFDERAFEHLWEDFGAELDEPDWVFRAVANVRRFTAEGGPFDLGYGVSVRGRSFEELSALGFDDAILAALTDDWWGFGASSYVMLVETRKPKSPDNVLLGSLGTEWIDASRALGAMRLLAPGDISIGRINVRRHVYGLKALKS